MAQPSLSTHGRGRPIRLLLLALAGVVAIGAAVVLGLRDDAEPVASLPAPSAKPPVAAQVPAKPSFDTVRVNPQGDAVIAGHAAPGAEVRIADGGHEIGRVQAGPDGAWVFVPSQPLAAGGRELTLLQRTPSGQETASEGSVLLVVPDRSRGAAQATAQEGAGETPLAALSTPGEPPRMLQSAPSGGLGLDAAEADQRGAVRLTGRAPPGASVRVYLDDHPVGDTQATAQGRWMLAVPGEIALGQHRLRIDQLDPGGRVVARAEAPLPADRQPASGGASRVTVERGETLWRIARTMYGSGTRYTVLYQANRTQIRDPARIYPGQVIRAPAPSEHGAVVRPMAATP